MTQNILVTRILFRGNERYLDDPLQVYNVQPDKLGLGGLICNINGYNCPKCNQNWGYLHFSLKESGPVFFCGEDKCLKDDSNASKGMKISQAELKPEEIDASRKFGLGSKYLNASLSKWRCTQDHGNLVSNWIKNPKNMLVFVGAPRTGKTYCCVALANYFLAQKRHVRFLNSRRFFEEIQKAIASNQNQYDVIRNISDSDILILDDIGASTNSEWQKEVLLDLIDRRYSSEKPTIINTNFNEEQLKKDLGERTSSRIFSENNIILGISPC